MLVRSIVLIVSLGCVTATVPRAAFAQTESKSLALKSPSDFESIGDQAERSRAIFVEIGKLLTHPRCMNCHPAGNHPLQGADHHEHMPPVWRSDAEHLGTHCSECHTDNNVTLHEAATYQSIPGHPRWGLAPLSMAWEGQTVGDICRRLKDASRNGGRDLAAARRQGRSGGLGVDSRSRARTRSWKSGIRRGIGPGLDQHWRAMPVARRCPTGGLVSTPAG